jgi:4-hydroxy-3-methylbut-2-enyl diphosphate reductase IspH
MWRKLKVGNPEHLSYVTQTTLSMDDTSLVIDALRERFPTIEGAAEKRYMLCHPKSPRRC